MLTSGIRDYEIVVKVVDFLINEEVITDSLVMRGKSILKRCILEGDHKFVKLEMGYQTSPNE